MTLKDTSSSNPVWEDVDKEKFSVFIRDLSQSVNANLKHMISDLEIKQKKHVVKPPKQKQKKHISKKDMIIKENNERLMRKNEEKDHLTIQYLLDNLNLDDPYEGFSRLKTSEAKTYYKVELLRRYWSLKKRKTYISHIINLSYHLKDEVLSPDQRLIVSKIQGALEKFDLKEHMLNKMGHLLPPLNFWDQTRELDDWQTKVIQLIREKKSVLVRAPTSAGKTFVAMSTGIIHSRIIYICPAKPVAYQVGAAFVKMGYRAQYLVENHCESSYDKQTNIFVGTPDCVETMLPKIGLDFDYAVFDEIHTLDDPKQGLPYENLVKLLRCPCLALSATIGNINFLREIFSRYHPRDIEYIEYRKRFINQQRWIYMKDSNKVMKLHPLISFDCDNPESFMDITMTPSDCYTLYQLLDEEFSDTEFEKFIEFLDPDEYFQEDRLLTLDDTKRYESSLKEAIMRLCEDKDSLPIMKDIYKTYCSNDIQYNEGLDDLVQFLQICRKKDLLPMLYFHTKSSIVKEIYESLDIALREKEANEYPYHYHILEKKEEYYQEYLTKRETFESNIKLKGSKDAITDKQAKLERFDHSQKSSYLTKVIDLYDRLIDQCRKHECDDETKNFQVIRLKRDREHFIKNPDFRSQDVFQKHPDYCFTRGDPMSGDEIRSIRREIRSAIGQTISYEHPLFQLLKRGVGVYLENFPDEYNRVVQRLVSQKRLGIVLSDRTLCLGIDLPIRSVAFSGYRDPNYTKSDYLQMSGRAGRRGHDNQGNIIFHNVKNYKELMRGELPQIRGSEKEMYDGYHALKDLVKNSDLDSIYHSRISGQKSLEEESFPNDDPRKSKIGWYLRYHKEGLTLVNELNRLEKRVFRESEDMRDESLLTYLIDKLSYDSNLLHIYKSFKISEDMDRTLSALYDLGEVVRQMIRHLHPIQMKLTITSLKNIFDRIKSLRGKYLML